MPRTGGEADKFGNRYESLWTVDAVLDLMEGKYTELTVEPLGDEAAGIEFVATYPSGNPEYHSIKRQHSRGNWTVNALTHTGSNGRSILGDLVRKVQDEDATAVFSSGTSADELERLIEGALSSGSLQHFRKRIEKNARLSARFYDRLAPICGGEEGAYETLRRLCVRTANEPLLKQKVEQRVRRAFRRADGQPLQPRPARLLIADIVVDKLGEPLTATSLLAELEGPGVVPSQYTGDWTVGEQMRRVNSSYLNETANLLINRAEIPREESKSAISVLLEDRRSVMLEGRAGGGKTGVLAQVVERLEAQDIPCLAIRLDRLSEADRSAQALGTNRGLPESPATTLGEFAGERPSVLCIDQLDALSVVSSRQQWAWDVLNELLDEAETYPNMRLLFSCRSFDLEQDARLRALADNQDEVKRVAVGLLDEETIRSAIDASGLATPRLTADQIEVLSTPLHLYLYLEASQSGRVDFRAPGELFDAFWLHKERAVEARTAPKPSGWSLAISALCNALSDRESLSAPDFVLDAHGGTLEALASEGVVSKQAGSVSFFHESFFDYAFARTFLGAGSDLVEWLARDEQALFRRSQVRQVLAFLRGREGSESRRYLRTVERLLDHNAVRFHIKRLVLDWLGGLPDPTEGEWLLVEARRAELGWHVWAVVSGSVPWFDLLHGMGRWEQWLTSDDERIDRAAMLLSTPTVLEERTDTVAELFQRHRGQSEEWRRRTWFLVGGGDGYASAKMQRLMIELVSDGTLDAPAPPSSFDRDIWTVLYRLSTEAPTFTARVVGAWFDRQVVVATEQGSDDPFADDFSSAAQSQSSEHVIEESGKGAPREFAQEFFARFVRLEQRAPQQYTLAPGALSGPGRHIREVLVQAMSELARQDPETLDSLIEKASGDGHHWTKWMSVVALQAWSSNPEAYADRIVSFLLERPEQRFDLGYDISTDATDSFAAISRKAVAAASLHCSASSHTALEEAIVDFTPDREWKYRKVGRTRLALLRSLDQGRVTEATLRHIQELARKFPEAPERGAPEPPGERGLEWVASPVPQGARSRMSDANWLSAMAKYTSDRPTLQGDKFVGGAEELARELTEAAREAPERFAALADRMDGSFVPTYFEALLRGLTRGEDRAFRPGTLDQVCSVLRRVRELGVGLPGKEAAYAIETLAEEELPADVFEMLQRVALEDPSPQSDDSSWGEPLTQAVNSGRGAAAVALARLLFADRSRWTGLKPTVKKLVTDRVLAVRAVAVECLTAVLDSDRDDALRLFEMLVDGAESILATRHVEGFIHYAIFRDYARLRGTLRNMLASTSLATVEVGAKQIVVAALWGDTTDALEDEDFVLRLGEDARVGAAEVYAANLANPTVGPKCEIRLREMFDDDSEAVRRAAGHCWASLRPDEVASRGEFIGAYAHSRAFIDSRAGFLLHQLEKAEVPLPMEVCALAERAVEEYGNRATSIQTAEGGDAYGFSKLLVRLHEQTSDPTQRKRILDVIDGMVRAGFLGMEERLREQFER